MKKISAAAVLLLAAAVTTGCGGDKKSSEPKEDMPENIISYEDRDGKDFIPTTEEHGQATEAEPADLPSEEELGEYQEIFFEGDIIDEKSCGGWVVAVSVKDITINTYNTLTKYLLTDGSSSTAARLKPGDAVLVVHHEDEDGNQVADELGRVRMEDPPLSKEEIKEMYEQAQEAADGEPAETENE